MLEKQCSNRFTSYIILPHFLHNHLPRALSYRILKALIELPIVLSSTILDTNNGSICVVDDVLDGEESVLTEQVPRYISNIRYVDNVRANVVPCTIICSFVQILTQYINLI
jgi:hypothetical protein